MDVNWLAYKRVYSGHWSSPTSHHEVAHLAVYAGRSAVPCHGKFLIYFHFCYSVANLLSYTTFQNGLENLILILKMSLTDVKLLVFLGFCSKVEKKPSESRSVCISVKVAYFSNY